MTLSALPGFLLAQCAPPATGAPGAAPGSPLQFMVPMLIIFGLFYMLVILPQRRKDKDRKKLIENTKSGDRVLFSGGIMGTITNVKEHTFVVKIAEKVKIEILRAAVLKVLEKDEVVSDPEQ
jgi:preprotein translocase subunit YajC